MTLKNNRAPLSSVLRPALCIISKPLVNSNWSYIPDMPNSGQNQRFFCPMWPWNLTDDLKKTMGHLFYATSKLCASFHSHWWIQTVATVRKRKVSQNWRFFVMCDPGIGWMTLKNNRATLLCHLKFCASFHYHMWILSGVTVRKRLHWVLTSVALTFDLWPWPFAWTSLLSVVITPENFIMIRWWEHSKQEQSVTA